MKITKQQLKEHIRKVVREQLESQEQESLDEEITITPGQTPENRHNFYIRSDKDVLGILIFTHPGASRGGYSGWNLYTPSGKFVRSMNSDNRAKVFTKVRSMKPSDFAQIKNEQQHRWNKTRKMDTDR